MDASLAVASKRDQRQYAERPVPEDTVSRILDAGGRRKRNNRQRWRFLVLGDRGLVDQLRRPSTQLPTCSASPLMIAIVISGEGPVAFDAGRTAPNMMLAAWNVGVVSCPNGIANPDSLA